MKRRYTPEEAYDQLVPFIWAAVDKKTGRSSGEHAWDAVFHRVRPVDPPFTFAFGRPAPTVKASNGPIGGPQPARDFPNPEYEWGHPTREDFLRAYVEIEEEKEYWKARIKAERKYKRRRWGFLMGFWRA